MIGFVEEEAEAIANSFASEHGKGYGYFRLLDDNLQDPDLYLVNADELKALVTLSDLTPSAVRPALLVGVPQVSLPYPHVPRPLYKRGLLEALDSLVEKRADTLSRLEAASIVAVPERRRADRVHIDLTDPSEYERMRTRGKSEGGILIIDKNPAFREYVSDLLLRYSLPIAWASTQNKASDQCEANEYSVVLVNTSTPGIDPYDLCEEIKLVSAVRNPAVIFLVSKPFVYDVERARDAKVDGYMNKPIASHHLMAVLKKFMPALSR
ncbi:MAG TPA: response regulator [Burkholderiaceae bacterium]|jgi:CheY-like chemotaxis protein